MTDPVMVTDADTWTVDEGVELALQGRGYTPYPATPPPRRRPGIRLPQLTVTPAKGGR